MLRFRAKLEARVWLDQEPSRASFVEVILDESFSIKQLPQAGTALQAGAWEALKKAVEALAATTNTTTQIAPIAGGMEDET